MAPLCLNSEVALAIGVSGISLLCITPYGECNLRRTLPP